MKILYGVVCRTNVEYGCKLHNTALPGRLKKLDSIRREIIRGAFRPSEVEAMLIEADDLPLELKRKELGLRFLSELRSNTSYIETLNTLDDSEDQNYKENEGSIKIQEST